MVDATTSTVSQADVTQNPIVKMAGHVLVGGSAATLGYIAGEFISAVSTGVGFVALATLPLGVAVGGLTFAGYVGYVILNGWSSS